MGKKKSDSDINLEQSSEQEQSTEFESDTNSEFSDIDERSIKPIITIKKLNIVCTWDYDTDNKLCTLCNKQLTEPVRTNTEKISYDTRVKVGVCRHGFHKTCIDKITMDGMSCPICRFSWISNEPDNIVHSYKST